MRRAAIGTSIPCTTIQVCTAVMKFRLGCKYVNTPVCAPILDFPLEFMHVGCFNRCRWVFMHMVLTFDSLGSLSVPRQRWVLSCQRFHSAHLSINRGCSTQFPSLQIVWGLINKAGIMITPHGHSTPCLLEYRRRQPYSLLYLTVALRLYGYGTAAVLLYMYTLESAVCTSTPSHSRCIYYCCTNL